MGQDRYRSSSEGSRKAAASQKHLLGRTKEDEATTPKSEASTKELTTQKSIINLLSCVTPGADSFVEGYTPNDRECNSVCDAMDVICFALKDAGA